MAIEFVCPSCGRVLKLRDEAAGKRGRCPHCKSVITVPESAVSEDDLIEILSNEPATPKKPPAAPVKPPEPTPSEPTTPVEEELPPFARSAFAEATADEPASTAPAAQPKPEGKTCPGCGGALAESAVICVKCGFNLKTGKKLETVFEEPEPEPEPEPEKPDKPEETGKPETPEG